jgi:hypothetical protein
MRIVRLQRQESARMFVSEGWFDIAENSAERRLVAGGPRKGEEELKLLPGVNHMSPHDTQSRI